MESKVRILCCREIQKSIKDSVHKLLSDKIAELQLESFYTVKVDSIVGVNGTEFIFKGLRHNIQDIKSTEGIDYCWVEESQTASQLSLDILIPTIRKPGSQIIFTYNPTNEDDPVHVNYTLQDRPDTLKIKINWNENPFFPEVLKSEMEYDKRVDYGKYLHIWEGECQVHSDAQIFFNKWQVDSFETPENAEFYFGADWGFSQDPTTLIRSFILENTLYIDYEAYAIGVDLDKIPALFRTVPKSEKWTITGDSARPETISFLNQRGFRIESSTKGAGSVEDGIELIRSFDKIIIHERCRHTQDEFRLYSYKRDRLTDQIIPVPEDKNNHLIDALRYALQNLKRYASIRRYK